MQVMIHGVCDQIKNLQYIICESLRKVWCLMNDRENIPDDVSFIVLAHFFICRMTFLFLCAYMHSDWFWLRIVLTMWVFGILNLLDDCFRTSRSTINWIRAFVSTLHQYISIKSTLFDGSNVDETEQPRECYVCRLNEGSWDPRLGRFVQYERNYGCPNEVCNDASPLCKGCFRVMVEYGNTTCPCCRVRMILPPSVCHLDEGSWNIELRRFVQYERCYACPNEVCKNASPLCKDCFRVMVYTYENTNCPNCRRRMILP